MIVYDSDQPRPPVLTELRELWRYRGLVGLITSRDLTLRYKRSALGVWWTLLNPLLTTAVLWIVFSAIFRFPTPGVPYVVYLLSGVLVANLFAQGVLACGGSLIESSDILTRVYVPPIAFSTAAAAAASVNFMIGLVPLLVVQLFTGVGIAWTVVFVPVLAFGLMLFLAGIGLTVAAIAVYYYDVMTFTSVLLQLVTYLTPVFYPFDIVPDQLRIFVEANPLHSFLLIFRHLAYIGTVPPTHNLIIAVVAALVSIVLGTYIFSVTWRRLASML